MLLAPSDELGIDIITGLMKWERSLFKDLLFDDEDDMLPQNRGGGILA